ncbi:GlxA family transcriptional regulator [Pseudomonas fluorescens]|uniref:choline metabolism transcriptional regulator GbdR n=1 Tax=Pseudomonas simiae TaxID=321846 RepID=UPI00084DEFBD|nr:GlxA family transcriptional regulator [Pseudomonas simiae]MBD8739925.1 GlxA family transcriptional regulator [Pseudomonas fluorescens]MBI6614498.1 GlxA family transcriptional regulator [Pseudomonas simiae]TKK02604.1 GlxA family transcriptional regulator [Pseudomonas fluorescens]WLH20457.1 GlxA family transcriptional regulator [Pseudomonas simiae]SFB33668.1 Transcriptional regulator GlxA family, contains an amidase domain and an AraC-type DNA-binding HTH domain [Pseudomonas simiae]
MSGRPVSSIVFLLLDQFTLMSLASAVEPLRMANQLSGQELYKWHTASSDGNPVWASDGVPITPEGSIFSVPPADIVIVCGGIGIQGTVTGELVKWLRGQARYAKRLGGICTGSFVLARAGLLDGYECSVHWEWLAAMQEAFPRVTVSSSLFSLDRDRLTSSGGTAPLDMMLHLIGRDHGHELSAAISDMFVYERIRNEQDHQRVPLKHMLGTQQPKLQEIVALMEANLEEPINLDELAAYVALSRRQLERMFQKYLHCSPSRYYLRLRLIRARQLLKQTPISIVELAVLCGFVSTPHFSKCYREYFGVPPSDERSITDSERATVIKPVMHALPTPVPMNVMEQARGEATFASVKNLKS